MPEDKKFLTVEQYGQHRNVSRQQVYKYMKTGKLTKGVVKVGKKTMIDKAVADSELAQNMDKVYNRTPHKKAGGAGTHISKGRSKPTVPEMKQVVESAGLEDLSLSEAQRLQANYKAALLKLELDQKSDLLVEKEKVRAEAFEAGRIVRDGVLNIPDRLSAELASCTDVHAVSQKLMDAFNEVLGDLSDK